MRRFAVAAAFAVQISLVAQAGDPLLGMWRLDRTQSTFSDAIPLYGGGAPATRIMTFERVPAGIRHVIETTLDSDSLADAYRIEYTFRVDGRSYPADPQMPVASVSFTRLDERTIRRTGTYQGKPAESSTWRVSADGRTLTVTQNALNHDAAGNEVEVRSTQVFTRVLSEHSTDRSQRTSRSPRR